jgi:DNA-binding response OmpR family regulator
MHKGLQAQRIGPTRPTSLHITGNRVLVVEDEPLVGMNLSKSLTELGFDVVGPYSTLAQAAEAAVEEEIDAALLDVNLSGDAVYPVADILASKSVPFAFITGYATDTLSGKYANFPVLQKPVDHESLRLLLAQKHPALAGLVKRAIF